jgi:FkbM family methyltransferase
VLRLSLRRSVRVFWGDRLVVVLPEEVSGQILRYRFHDFNTTTFLLRSLSPGMTFVDIGAHIGYFTLLAAKIVGVKGAVEAFEPSPWAFRVLERNTAGKTNVSLFRRAVMASRGTVRILDLGPRYSAYNTVYQPRLEPRVRTRIRESVHEVAAVSLDEHIAETGVQPDFVKIDAESAEQQILEGMVGTLEKQRPFIALEVGDMGVPGVPLSRDVIGFLIERRYRPFENDEGRLVPHKLQRTYRYSNLLFVPEHRA